MPTTMEKLCRTCKFPFSFPTAEATFPCPACGAVNGRPQAEGMSYDCLKRATRQRLACDFHNAEVSYQHVLLEYEEEHEALWGLALCRYGVEYVQDTKTGKLMPTVHSIRKKPMQADSDYLAACEYAPEELRARYEAEAAYIDDAMTGVRKLAETQQPYDVFICHKKTVPGSENLTPEYGKAAEMAHHLEKQGYRVFFAPEAIKSELGADYEAAIYHALDTAKVMLMFCSNVEYVTSAWVRSEWTRFLEMATEREDKRLVPLLYGDFTPAKLPRELRPYRLECVTMDSFTAASDILRLLEKCCGKRGTEEAAREPEKPVQEKKTVREKKSAPAKPAQEKPAEAKTTAPKKPAPVKPAAEKKPAPAKKPTPAPVPVPAKPAPIYTLESDFETAPVKGGCSITKYRGLGGDVKIPPTIGGQKVVEIGKAAFEKCKSLTGVTLPEGVQWIQNGAFSQCDKLAHVTLPGSLKRIDCNAFSHCVALKSVTLPDRLTTLEHAAFSYSGLVSVKLPDSLKKVEGNPFWQCGQLTHIQLSPAHLCLEVRDGALMDKTEKKLICYPAGLNADHYRVPEDIRIIELGAFGGCVHLKNVTLPEGLRTIEGAAFSDCSGLRSMSIPDSVREIGLHAFNGCTALTNVTLPEAADVNDKAFGWCDNLKPENIVRRPKARAAKGAPAKPAGAKKPAPAKPAPIYTPESDFETAPVAGGCSITKYRGLGGDVKIPPTIGGLRVVEIGKNAFNCCSSLTGITLPEGLTSIGECAFDDCSSLTGIVLPEGLTSIGERAFNCCSSLTSITLPDSVTSIGEWAFQSCNSLTSITLPSGLTSIWRGVFAWCKGLRHVVLPVGLTSIETQAFWHCISLTSITLPKSLTSIGGRAFDECSSLTSITLPEGLTSIGVNAFADCSSLPCIVLPKSLRNIGEAAFVGCSKLPLSQKLKFVMKGLM